MSLIKFFFKIIIVLVVAFAAVIYHNTDSGKEMERRIGKEINFESLSERGEELLRKTIYFLSLKGLEYKEKGEKKQKDAVKEEDPVYISSPPAGGSDGKRISEGSGGGDKKDVNAPIPATAPGSDGEGKREHIEDEDRKRLEQIIEFEG